ncbi:TIGR03364 family FAD-dependent oxidoreductase [Roseovarius arcticus]|uniref:TIGR03364 family FAD-dependent oxidoreductase n=1 Tax=Roseovarius arcticus TaxID=2547404 RepID=UPI001110A013|nr:TIGR03364 family FAD-dependent oxidoreductase [Roseovarius arcticus]
MTYDLAVVGGGILGLAHAWQGARAGLRVAVFERGTVANGASVRNFGMLAIVAQRPGPELDSARATLDAWREVAAGAGLTLRQAGCLFVARQPEEMAVLAECSVGADAHGQDFTLLDGAGVHESAAGLNAGALGGLYSPDAWKVDQRGALAAITAWLAREFGVTFHFGAEVCEAADGRIVTADSKWRAEHIVICGGDDFARLHPNAWRETSVTTCRLQMLRTAPQPADWRLGPFVLGGLSLARYSAFADCASLPALKTHQAAHQADALAHGVHIIAAQEADGSVTLGDSHHYGAGAAPDYPAQVDDLIMNALDQVLTLPDRRIAERWVGNYAYMPGHSSLRLTPAPGVTAVTVTNGQGMTHSFQLAKETIQTITGWAVQSCVS